MADRNPTAGVRLQLELDGADDKQARYRGAVLTPEGRHDFAVTIALPSGDVEVAALQQGAPGADLLRMLARTVVKDATATTPPTWPRRILRWRDKDL